MITAQTITKMNFLLESRCNDLKNTGTLSHQKLDDLLKLINSCPRPILFFKDELVENQDDFLKVNKQHLQSINLCKMQIDKIRDARSKAVEEENFEKAARLRDEERKVYDQMQDEILKANRLVEGFNLFESQILIVWPQNTHKQTVLKKLIELSSIVARQ